MRDHMILILEDNGERIAAFEEAVRAMGATIRLWRDAPTMLAECADCLPFANLISLDHDLMPATPDSPDPGTGLEVAEFLATFPPACEVIIHTTNIERRWSMHNELRHAGWKTTIVAPLTPDWIKTSWSAAARTAIGL